MKETLRTAASKKIATSSLRIALAVGTALNLINQWSAIFGSAEFSWLHGLLNYLVPFCVASYSAARHHIASAREPRP